MKRHGLRRFYVVNEGVFGEQRSGAVDGKKIVPAKAADAAGGAPDATFRFSRMGPAGAAGAQLGGPTRQQLAEIMTVGDKEFSRIPSGYTYLGQFIDHDLTIDKTGGRARHERVRRPNAAGALAGARPRLALRRGPGRSGVGEVLPGRRLHLKMGKTGGRDGLRRPRRASTCLGPARAERRRSSPTRGTTRTSPSPRPTWRSSASTTGSSTRCRASVPAAQASSGRGRS